MEKGVDTNLKFSINLLPIEVIRAEIIASKYYKLRVVSFVIVLTMIFLSSATLALRILQSNNIRSAQNSVEVGEDKVIKFKGAESSLVVLKNRLVSIDQLTSTASPQRDLYNLITASLPPSLSINSIAADRSGIITLTLTGSDSGAVDEFMASLLKQSNKVSSVEIESLSRGRDGIYRVTLKIVPKS